MILKSSHFKPTDSALAFSSGMSSCGKDASLHAKR